MSITVQRPGLATTLQDTGRHGHQALGVPVGGAMDLRAHQLANLMAGNTTDMASLEITLLGPELRFNTAACVALTGADLGPTVNRRPVPMGRPLILRAGDRLAFGKQRMGVRCYLACHGGFDVAPVLGSQSTYVRGSLGGFHGRALRKGDSLPLRMQIPSEQADELANALNALPVYLPGTLVYQPRKRLRVLRGPHTPLFTEAALHALFNTGYRISNESDRMGFRLEGARLPVHETQQLLSEGASFGSIQVPTDGQPIILMADRQSIGGYPKIGHVANVDLPQLAQCMPGDVIRFEEVALEQARQLDQARELALAELGRALHPLREVLARHIRAES